MKITLSLLLGLSLNAHAILGGRTAEVENGLPRISHRRSVVHRDPNNCYTVNEVRGDGVGVRQYINNKTDTVFMVRANSRVLMGIEPLMKAGDFVEFRQAREAHPQSLQRLTRNHKRLATETTRLKVLVDDRQSVHRSVMILKSSVPPCVQNPEALP